MSSTRSDHRQGWLTPGHDAISQTDPEIGFRDDGVTLLVSEAISKNLLPEMAGVPAGDFGVAMCFLPLDISLRAYAIEAIRRVASERGLGVLSRRDVPVCAEVLGAGAFTRPHVAQFFILRPCGFDLDTFEHELMVLRAEIEREMADLGMMSDDVQVISCSARTMTYRGVAGHRDLAALYPDLADVPTASMETRFRGNRASITRPSWKLA